MLARLIILAGMAVTALARDTFAEEAAPKTVIALGSCAHQSRSQAFWAPILSHKPDYFIFGGDNMYSDTYNMDLQRKKYQQLADQEGFQQLKKQSIIMATWDDHDYGLNDSGLEFREKAGSQKNFLDFWGVPARSPRREQEGIYDATVVDVEGRRLQFIILDTRYHRSELVKKAERKQGEGRYTQNSSPNATILGEAQWAWLEKQLEMKADIRFIVSSIQVVPQDHLWESWFNFPRERNRLFRLIRSTGAEGVIFLTGDRHMAELSRHNEAGVGYPLYDLTSSGLNMARGGHWPETNRYRIGRQFFENHFGLITIAWEKDPSITLQIRDLSNKVVIEHALTLDELRARL